MADTKYRAFIIATDNMIRRHSLDEIYTTVFGPIEYEERNWKKELLRFPVIAINTKPIVWVDHEEISREGGISKCVSSVMSIMKDCEQVIYIHDPVDDEPEHFFNIQFPLRYAEELGLLITTLYECGNILMKDVEE